MKNLGMLAWWLMVIGGLNWGLVGAFEINLVSMIFGSWMWLEKLIYIVVGLSTIYVVLQHFEVV